MNAKLLFALSLLTVFHVQAATVVWTNVAAGNASGSWAAPLNWSPNSVPGALDLADFSTLDLMVPSIISLDGNQSINALLFGDLDATTNSPAAGWTIASSVGGSDILTLASPAPTITVNDLFPGETVTIDVPLAGSDGLIKAGPGALRLARDNTYTGDTTITGGTLQIGAGANSGSVPGNILLNGGSVLFDRADGFSPAGIISADAVLSAARTSAGSGPVTLTFGEGTNLFGAIQNASSNTLVLKATVNTTNFFPGPNSGAPNNGDGALRNTSDDATLVIDGGTWVLNGANWSVGVGNMWRGTNYITNATLIAGGGRYMRGITHLQNGASLLITNGLNLDGGSANISRLSFEGDPPRGNVTGIYVSEGAFLDVWAGGFALDIGTANATRGSNCVGFIHQAGGIVQRAVNGLSSGGNGRSIFIGSPNPEYTGYYTLEAGKLICTDLIGPRFTNPQYISTNFFNWTGGLLSCRTFEARLLVGGTLTNAGGIFAPGDIGLAASTTVNGGYYVASSNAVLAIDLGGTMPANQAAGVVGVAGAYDNVRAEDAWLAGRLEVRFMDGFEATVTALDSFTILTTSPTHLSLHGTFDNVGTNGRVNVVNFPNFSFRVTINDASVVLDDFSGPPPQLAIRPEPMTPGLVTVSWATNAVGFVLQSAPRADAAPNDWADIPPELIFQNGALNEYFEFVEGTSGAFFRLRKN